MALRAAVVGAGRSVRVVRHSNSGHQLLLPPAGWCPTFAVWTTQVLAVPAVSLVGMPVAADAYLTGASEEPQSGAAPSAAMPSAAR